MRIVSFLVFLSATMAQDSSVEYMGFNATMNDGDVALCGTEIAGCVSSKSSHGYRCNAKATLGDLTEIGTDSQTWKYEDGRLISNAVSSSSWYSSSHERCLGIRTGDRHYNDAVDITLQESESYPLILQRCDNHASQRFVIANGRVQSLLGMNDDSGSGTPFCMSIDSTSPDTAAGAGIALQACNASNTLQQAIQAFSTQPLDSFVYSQKDHYELDDLIELSYFDASIRGDEEQTETIELNLFKTTGYDMVGDEVLSLVHSMDVVDSTGYVSLNLTEILGGNHAVLEQEGYYVAKLGEAEVSFLVRDDFFETCFFGRPFVNASSSELAVALGSFAALLVILGGCCCWRRSRRSAANNRAGIEDDDKTVVTDADGEVVMGKVFDEETASQTTKESNDEFLEY